MTKVPSSDCSSSLSDSDHDQLSSTFAKLRAVINQEASLRKDLVEQFRKRKEDAHIAVQNAQRHLELVKTQEANMLEILEKECAAAHAIRADLQNIPENQAGLSHDEGKVNTPNKHYQVEDPIGRKPTPNILSPTNENPPNLNATDGQADVTQPATTKEEDAEEAARKAQQELLDLIGDESKEATETKAGGTKKKKGTILKLTPAAKRAAKAKKPNLVSMSTEEMLGDPFGSGLDTNTQDTPIVLHD